MPTPSFFTKYGKTVLAALGALVVGVQAALTDGSISPQEWVEIGLVVLTALGVYAAPAVTKASAIYQRVNGRSRRDEV
jgi:hypothetical protein